jgi:DNA-binding CsgD family transcriptional regulator
MNDAGVAIGDGLVEQLVNVSIGPQELNRLTTLVTALVNRDEGPALIVDTRMRLVDANKTAMDIFSNDGILRLRQGRVSFSCVRLSDEIARSAASAAAIAQSHQHGHIDGEHHWLISLRRIPSTTASELEDGGAYVLVIMRDLRVRKADADYGALRSLYGLTPAETRLCISIVRGGSLSDAAARIGITYEHARQRIKVIFQKTQTKKQAELCVLLGRFAVCASCGSLIEWVADVLPFI